MGVLYGLTNTCVGHPWDTLKTKMQAQAGYEKTGMFQTFVKTLKTQGPIGLYRLYSVCHFNPFKPNVLAYPYQLDQSISDLRVVRCYY